MSLFKKDIIYGSHGENIYEDLKEINKMKAILRNNTFVQEVLKNITPESLKEPGIVKISYSCIEGRWANCKYSDYGLKDLSFSGCGAFARLIYEKIKSIEPKTDWKLSYYSGWGGYYFLQKIAEPNLKDW